MSWRERAEAERARLLRTVQGQPKLLDKVTTFLPNLSARFKPVVDDLPVVTEGQVDKAGWRNPAVPCTGRDGALSDGRIKRRLRGADAAGMRPYIKCSSGSPPPINQSLTRPGRIH